MLRIYVIGAGHMGIAILLGLRAKNQKIQIIGVDILDDRRKLLASHQIEALPQLPALSPRDTVVIAIPPQEFISFSHSCTALHGHPGLIVSVMAGIRMAVIAASLKVKQVVRAMPNTPSEVFEGVTVYCRAPELSEMNDRLVQQLLGVIGHFVAVDNEELIDTATALCGGGPAFFAYFADCMRQQAESAGFGRADASAIVIQLLRGTAILMSESGKSAMQLCREVMTPGGTTERGIDVFEERKLRSIVEDALSRSAQRSRELGDSITITDEA